MVEEMCPPNANKMTLCNSARPTRCQRGIRKVRPKHLTHVYLTLKEPSNSSPHSFYIRVPTGVRASPLPFSERCDELAAEGRDVGDHAAPHRVKRLGKYPLPRPGRPLGAARNAPVPDWCGRWCGARGPREGRGGVSATTLKHDAVGTHRLLCVLAQFHELLGVLL